MINRQPLPYRDQLKKVEDALHHIFCPALIEHEMGRRTWPASLMWLSESGEHHFAFLKPEAVARGDSEDRAILRGATSRIAAHAPVWAAIVIELPRQGELELLLVLELSAAGEGYAHLHQIHRDDSSIELSKVGRLPVAAISGAILNALRDGFALAQLNDELLDPSEFDLEALLGG